jgi:hypothetical protein
MGEGYNGWSNYATWRVKLELFDDDSQFEDQEVDAEYLKEQADEAITMYGSIKEPCLALDYARAFLQDVNWYEIAEAINNTNKEISEYEETKSTLGAEYEKGVL